MNENTVGRKKVLCKRWRHSRTASVGTLKKVPGLNEGIELKKEFVDDAEPSDPKNLAELTVLPSDNVSVKVEAPENSDNVTSSVKVEMPDNLDYIEQIEEKGYDEQNPCDLSMKAKISPTMSGKIIKDLINCKKKQKSKDIDIVIISDSSSDPMTMKHDTEFSEAPLTENQSEYKINYKF